MKYFNRRKPDLGSALLCILFAALFIVICILFFQKIQNTYQDRIAVATTYPHPTWPEPETSEESTEEFS